MMRGLAAGCAFAVLCCALDAHAENTGADASGLPSLHEVAVATALPEGVAAAMQTGYGYTPGVFDGAARHHRIVGAFAASLRPLPWFGVGLQLDSRFDRHVLATERDSSWVGTPRVSARASRSTESALSIGAEATLWFPGRDAPSIVVGATSADLVVIASYAPEGGRLRAAANLGFRMDRSAETADIAAEISRADRLSLGASAANAVLARVAAGVDIGGPELVAAMSWAPQVGADAAAPGDCPLLLSLGASLPVASDWELSARAVVNAGGNYTGEIGQPLAAFEPRLSILIGLGRFWRGFSTAPRTGTAEVSPEAEVVTAPAAPREPETPPAAETPPRDEPRPGVRGTVIDPQSRPVAGADVYLSQGGGERKTQTDAAGAFSFDGVAAGAATITVIAQRFEDEVVELDEITAEGVELEVTLHDRARTGEIRGAVLSSTGEPVQATLIIQPLGLQLETSTRGDFSTNIAPGVYTVVVRARRYRSQKRRVTVAPSGVTILNISLSAEKRR